MLMKAEELQMVHSMTKVKQKWQMSSWTVIGACLSQWLL